MTESKSRSVTRQIQEYIKEGKEPNDPLLTLVLDEHREAMAAQAIANTTLFIGAVCALVETLKKVYAPARIDPWSIERIYRAYPRKKGRAAAFKAIGKAIMDKELAFGLTDVSSRIAWMLRRVEQYAASRAGEDQDFTPYPATWFNQQRYLDEDLAPSQPKGSGWTTQKRTSAA